MLLRRSLGDTASGRAAHERIHRDQAGVADGKTVRRRCQGDRPFRLLPPRAPRHALAWGCGMDPGGVTKRRSRNLRCRPGEGQDPYRVIFRFWLVGVPNDDPPPNSSLGEWVLAFQAV